MTNRKQRFDTTAGMVDAFKAAQLKIEPPKHCILNPGAEPFYNAIIASRDAAMWNDADLGRAVTLANYQCKIRDTMATLEEEGEVITNDKGTPIMNPRFNVLNTITRLEVSLSKALQTDAASTQGSSREVSKRNAKARDAKAKIADVVADPLLGGLKAVK